MSNSTKAKVSSFVLAVIFMTLALSLASLILGINAFSYGNEVVGGYLLLIGFIGVTLSTYILLQSRKRLSRLKISVSPVTTTIECLKCGFKNLREFHRGDYIFKEVEPCKKCNDQMLITAIYREVKEKKKRRTF